jgi:selenide,water dikinase
MNPAGGQREIVLVGGGHAHVQVLTRFAMDPPGNARLTVVLDRPIAVYSGMVPGFVAGQYDARELEIDVVPMARRARARVILSAATGVDPERRTILFDDRPPVRYDIASLDIGSTVAGLHLPGVRENSLPTRPIGRFVARADELIEQATERAARAPFRIVVVGGGAGGVELAFTFEERLRRAGVLPRITLLDSAQRILDGYPDSLVRRIERHASARQVEVVTGARVVAADPGVAQLESGEPLPFDALLWVTGAAGHRLGQQSGLPVDERGFIRIRSTLQVVGHDDLFAVGDCGTLIDHPLTPKAGVYAVRQGPFVTENIRRRLAGLPQRAFTPQSDFLTLLNLGNGTALGAKWRFSFEGGWVMRWKDSIDRRFMRRFQVLDDNGLPAASFRGAAVMEGEMEVPCGGCAAKLGQEPLARALARLDPPRGEIVSDASGPVVEIGLSAPDDAAVWHTATGTRIGSSVDLFASFTDDPFLVGRVAAVNALSDLWATGISPRVAQALVAVPESLDSREAEDLLYQLLAGARTELDAAGVALAGGHTTTVVGRSLIGFAVDGELDTGSPPMRKGGLRPGDALVLTKPLGTGVVFRADMQGAARGRWISAAIDSMLRHNRSAARTAIDHRASAMTDITGFGLAGHLSEMLVASGVTAEIDLSVLPALPGAIELLARGERSTFHQQNRTIRRSFEVDDSDAPGFELLFDPQTSGGLLFGISTTDASSVVERLRDSGDDRAAVIGRVRPPRPDDVQVVVTADSGHGI